MSQHPKVPRLLLELIEIDVSREKLVRLERVSGEETLDVRLRQTPRVSLEKRAAGLPGQRGDFHG